MTAAARPEAFCHIIGTNLQRISRRLEFAALFKCKGLCPLTPPKTAGLWKPSFWSPGALAPGGDRRGGAPSGREAISTQSASLTGQPALLIALASVWCSTHDVGRIAIGSLGGNPFPDATPEFFESFGSVLSAGLG